MRASYSGLEEKAGVRQSRRKAAGRRVRKRVSWLSGREKVRLIQLLICTLVFAIALIGKGAFPKSIEAWRSNVQSILQKDTDFKGALVGLGRAISKGEPILETIGRLWDATFGKGMSRSSEETSAISSPVFQRELHSFTNNTREDRFAVIITRLGFEVAPAKQASGDGTENVVETGGGAGAGWEEHEGASQPALTEEKPQQAEYKGPALPANCTMAVVSLGLKETMTPVRGVVSSGFGYREHPVDKEYKFHYGLDIVADIGTPIRAFADGVVDFIGESKVYGKYIQLRHEGGVTTFYAHCSQLCFRKGQKVSKGDVIAKVGASGNATGPHLHLEIRQDGVYLNPKYYVETM